MEHPGHPHRLFTNRELKNFDRFRSLRENDRAFDSAIQHYYPNGIPVTAFAVEGAFDSKPRGLDEEPEAKPEKKYRGIWDTIMYTRDAMGPEGFKNFCEFLKDYDPEAEGAQDEPPPFKGRPRPGGKIDAMDHALAFDRKHKSGTPASFDRMYGNISAKPGDSDVAKGLAKLINAVGVDKWPGLGRSRG